MNKPVKNPVALVFRIWLQYLITFSKANNKTNRFGVSISYVQSLEKPQAGAHTYFITAYYLTKLSSCEKKNINSSVKRFFVRYVFPSDVRVCFYFYANKIYQASFCHRFSIYGQFLANNVLHQMSQYWTNWWNFLLMYLLKYCLPQLSRFFFCLSQLLCVVSIKSDNTLWAFLCCCWCNSLAVAVAVVGSL